MENRRGPLNRRIRRYSILQQLNFGDTSILNIKLDITGIFSIVIHISWYVKCPSNHQSFGTFKPLKFVDLLSLKSGMGSDPVQPRSWGWSLVVNAHAVKAGSTLAYICFSLSKINGVPNPLLNNTSVKGLGTGLFLVLRCHDDVMATSNLVKTCQVNWRSLRFLVNGHVLAQRTTVSSSLSRRGGQVVLRDKMVGWVISSHLS